MTPAALNLRADIRAQLLAGLAPNDRALLAAGQSPKLEQMIGAAVEIIARTAERTAALKSRERARWN